MLEPSPNSPLSWESVVSTRFPPRSGSASSWWDWGRSTTASSSRWTRQPRTCWESSVSGRIQSGIRCQHWVVALSREQPVCCICTKQSAFTCTLMINICGSSQVRGFKIKSDGQWTHVSRVLCHWPDDFVMQHGWSCSHPFRPQPNRPLGPLSWNEVSNWHCIDPRLRNNDEI